ncbi:MAG TPA: radical SAM protein, partial [Chthoniobacterales bacterium]|nr:radical SAM protein [Chthoniobacterales bacterium]
MIAVGTQMYRMGELHRFESADRHFIYLVPAGAIFELDEAAGAVLELVKNGQISHQQLMAGLVERGIDAESAADLINELQLAQVIVPGNEREEGPQNAPADFPLQTLVLNLTNQCNLSCQYCYEFGEDKVATPEGKKKFMDLETAKASVDFLLEQSAGRHAVHITFFGGETLMNFPLLKRVVGYATERAASQGRFIDFSLTTNATLLTPSIIQFLSDN